jgi:hypothetical protein
MGPGQLLIVLIFDGVIVFAIARWAAPPTGRDLGFLGLAGVATLPFAFLAPPPPFFLSNASTRRRSPATLSTCPPAARPASNTAPAVSELRVVPGWVAGNVDHSQILGNNAYFCGWAVSFKDRRVADSVAVFADGRLVGAIQPKLSRPDVARAKGGVGANSGFSVQLPINALEHQKRRRACRSSASRAA